MLEKETKSIRRNSQIGLWGSVGVVILTALFHLVSPYRFYPSEHTARVMLVVGLVLAVQSIGMTLRLTHKQTPKLRQSESLQEKVKGFAQYIRLIYLETLVTVVVICVLSVLSAQNMLLMLAMLATLVLFLAYPNIYRMKVMLGLTDEEMKSLFGEKYIQGEN